MTLLPPLHLIRLPQWWCHGPGTTLTVPLNDLAKPFDESNMPRLSHVMEHCTAGFLVYGREFDAEISHLSAPAIDFARMMAKPFKWSTVDYQLANHAKPLEGIPFTYTRGPLPKHSLTEGRVFGKRAPGRGGKYFLRR